MSDDTRPDGDDAIGPHPDRKDLENWVGDPYPASLGQQIDDLRTEGAVVLALALPWSESVRSMLDHFEQIVAPLHLDDELHRKVGEAAGIAELYEMLDTLSLAMTEIC